MKKEFKFIANLVFVASFLIPSTILANTASDPNSYKISIKPVNQCTSSTQDFCAIKMGPEFLDGVPCTIAKPCRMNMWPAQFEAMAGQGTHKKVIYFYPNQSHQNTFCVVSINGKDVRAIKTHYKDHSCKMISVKDHEYTLVISDNGK